MGDYEQLEVEPGALGLNDLDDRLERRSAVAGALWTAVEKCNEVPCCDTHILCLILNPEIQLDITRL